MMLLEPLQNLGCEERLGSDAMIEFPARVAHLRGSHEGRMATQLARNSGTDFVAHDFTSMVDVILNGTNSLKEPSQ